MELKSFKEFITEAKAKDGEFFVIEMPTKENDYKPSLVSGPHKTHDEAKKAGDGEYGLNQKQVISQLVKGKLMHVDHNTNKANDKPIAKNLGSRNSNMEKDMGLA